MPVVADFSGIPNELIVDFIDLSTGSPDSWAWDFGDPVSGINNTSNLQNPTHIFSGNGNYTVTLTATAGVDSNIIQKTISVSEYIGVPEQLDTRKLTHETDDSRPITYSSAVEDNNGRKIIFFQKNLVSGRTSDGRVQDAGGLNITVDAGSGFINSIPVTWTSINLIVQPNKFQLVYVTSSGIVGITDNFDMTFTASVIMLAYVFAGASAITRLHEIEKDGKYIYARRQKPDGMGGWIWDNYEDILNSGEQPQAIFRDIDNKIYVTYKKDSAVYQRITEVGNEANAWQYLLDFNIVTGPQIVLDTDPFSQIETDSSASEFLLNTFDPFTFSTLILGFQTEYNGTEYNFSHKYLFMPSVITAVGLDGIELEIDNYQIYIGSSESQILIDSFDFSSNKGTWRSIDSLNGTFYLGWTGHIKLFGRRLSYTLPPSNRLKIFIESTFFDTSGLDHTTITGKVHEATKSIISSASDAINNIDFSFDQLIDNQVDDTLAQQDKLMGSVSDVFNDILATYDQIISFDIDDTLTQTDKLSSSVSDVIFKN